MQVDMLSRSRLSESSSSSCPSVRLCEDSLQLKCVMVEGCPVRGVTEGEGRARRQVCLDERMKLKRIVGRGPVEGEPLQ